MFRASLALASVHDGHSSLTGRAIDRADPLSVTVSRLLTGSLLICLPTCTSLGIGRASNNAKGARSCHLGKHKAAKVLLKLALRFR